jgi:glucokinase
VEKQTKIKRSTSFAVGVDLGATTIKAGIVDRNGKILKQTSVDSKAMKGPDVVMKQMVLALNELLMGQKTSECRGIGIGSPGVVSSTTGVVQHPPNFADWGNYDVAKAIRRSFSLPVVIENDANAAAIAEARFGAGADHKDFLFVIWGTGVGGGIILDKKIYRGPHGGAGEIGHVTVDYNGRLCGCGNKGCVESYIGQRHLSQRTREILKSILRKKQSSKIIALVGGDLKKIEPAIISKAAVAGDPVAREIMREAGQLLGVALASIMNVLDLRVAVVGGGISAAPPFVFKAITSSIKTRILQPHKAGVKVVRAELGNAAGIIGAASLVL